MGRIVVNCSQCKLPYEVYQSQIKHRGSSFCSVQCRDDYRRYHQSSKLVRSYCDNIFSRYIRARDQICQRCGKTENLQCAHILSRSYSAVRCDPDNAIAMCYSCHIGWWHHNPVEAGRWFDNRWPGRYDSIRKKTQKPVKVDWRKEYRKIQDLYGEIDPSQAWKPKGPSRKSECHKGHPLTESNILKSKDGHRRCKECHKLRERRRKGKIKDYEKTHQELQKR